MINSSEYIRLMSFLKRFDCNNREAATYLECLQMGTSSVQEIAKKLNSNRITTHSTIEQLIKKGLLFETRKGKKRLIVAESPDVLYRILQRKANEIKLIEKDLDDVSKLLYSVQTQDQSFWNVRLYEGEDGFKKLLEETFSSQNGLLVFTCGDLSNEIVTASYLHDYYKRLAQNNIHSRIICSANYAKNFQADQLRLKMQLRIAKLPSNSSARFYLWNDVIALISFKDDRIVCTVIQNQDIASFFRSFIFENFWKSAEPLN